MGKHDKGSPVGDQVAEEQKVLAGGYVGKHEAKDAKDTRPGS